MNIELWDKTFLKCSWAALLKEEYHWVLKQKMMLWQEQTIQAIVQCAWNYAENDETL